MAREKICGIYMIKNKINGKVYVGQSIDIYKRWDEHKRSLNNKYKKVNDHLQKAWIKYGKENFEFSIIEKCKKNLLNKREMFWVKELDSFNKTKGYNKTSGGCQRRKVSDEFKERLRKVNLYIHRGENSDRAKYSEVQVRHVKMLLYCHMTFKGINEITQVPIEYISKIKNLDKWQYTLEEVNEYIRDLNLQYNPSIPIIMYDKKMNKIREFDSAKEASIITGYKNCNISSCCNFRSATSNNYVWLKKDENLEKNIKLKIKQLNESQQYIIHMVDNEENIIETFNSIADICRKYNLDNSSVSKVIEGKIKHTKGFKFKKEYIQI